MTPEIQAAWVRALRSGEYKQGRGTLKQNDCFCCLGVLCKVLDIDFDDSESPKVDHNAAYSDFLPLTEEEAEKFWRMNDRLGDRGYANSFLDIADEIERTVFIPSPEIK
jgi:hypothetical protein